MKTVEGVTVRKFKLRDTFKMKTWGNFEDTRFLHYNFPYTGAFDIITWYYMKKRGKDRILYGAFDSENRLLGYIVLKNIDFEKRSGEIGVSFNADRVGSGYGTKALKAFIQIAFDELKMNKIWLRTAIFNERAWKAYLKVGFVIKEEVNEAFEEQFYAYEIMTQYPGFTMVGDTIHTKYYRMEIERSSYNEH